MAKRFRTDDIDLNDIYGPNVTPGVKRPNVSGYYTGTEDLKFNFPKTKEETQGFFSMFKNGEWGNIIFKYGIPVLGISVAALTGNAPAAIAGLVGLFTGSSSSGSTAAGVGTSLLGTLGDIGQQGIHEVGEVSKTAIEAGATNFAKMFEVSVNQAGGLTSDLMKMVVPAAINALGTAASSIAGGVSSVAGAIKGWAKELSKSSKEKWYDQIDEYLQKIPKIRALQEAARPEEELVRYLNYDELVDYFKRVKLAVDRAYPQILQTVAKDIAEAEKAGSYKDLDTYDIINKKQALFRQKFRKMIDNHKPDSVDAKLDLYVDMQHAIDKLGDACYTYLYETGFWMYIHVTYFFGKNPINAFDARMNQIIESAIQRADGARNQLSQRDADLAASSKEKLYTLSGFSKQGSAGYGKIGRFSRRKALFPKGSKKAKAYMAYVRSFRK